MLRYLNLLFLSIVLVSLMACSAPGTNTIRDKNTVDENSGAPSDPGYQPPAGLPDNIDDLLAQLVQHWAGETAIPGEFFYLKKDGASSNGQKLFRIEILTRATTSTPLKKIEFFTLKEFASSSVTNGIWKADFFLKGSDGKLNLNTKMGLEMKFLTLKKAEVKFYPKLSGSGLKDYGTFIVTSQ